METELEPNALSMLVIGVDPARQGERLGGRMLEASRDAAREAGLSAVLAPVRPTLKDRYPLIPIERYLTWRRPDGSHFDPWLRLHERVGGEILAPAPDSMKIEASGRRLGAVDGDGLPGGRRLRRARACSTRSAFATAAAGTSSRTSGSFTGSDARRRPCCVIVS